MKYRILNNQIMRGSMAAWLSSRPTESEATVDQNHINSIDCPVNEFDSMMIEVTASIFVREIFASMRDHTIWAQGSRVNPVEEFEVDEHFAEYSDFMDCCRNDILCGIKNGEIQDVYRKWLPMASKTTFATMINLRQAVKLWMFFADLANTCKNEHMSAAMFSAMDCMYEIMMRFNENADYTSYKFVDFLPAFDIHHGLQTESSADVVVVYNLVPMMLRAQIIRHRLFSVTDDLKEVITSADPASLRLIDDIHMRISAPENVWQYVLSKRSCWMVDIELWSGILREYQSKSKSDNPALPCSNGSCPYDGDAQLRLESKIPGAPCPIHAKLTDQVDKVTDSQCDKIYDQIIDESRSVIWYDAFDSMKEAKS